MLIEQKFSVYKLSKIVDTNGLGEQRIMDSPVQLPKLEFKNYAKKFRRYSSGHFYGTTR